MAKYGLKKIWYGILDLKMCNVQNLCITEKWITDHKCIGIQQVNFFPDLFYSHKREKFSYSTFSSCAICSLNLINNYI